jgi:putative flippase GtrA
VQVNSSLPKGLPGRLLTRQFLAFLLAGGIAALANFGSRIALGLVMPYVPSIVLAYCIGMLTAFVLNRLLVFKDAGNALGQQALWFVLVNLAAVAQTVLISLLLARWLFPAIGMDFHPETLAHAAGVAVPVVTSYLGHKHLSFRTG